MLRIIPGIILTALVSTVSVFPGTDFPERAVSLSPSITRQMIDLGLGDRLVGVTSYCPDYGHRARVVGTLMNPSIEKILSLTPDIVLFSEEDSAIQKTSRIISAGMKCKMFPSNTDFRTLCNNYIDLAELFGRKELGEHKVKLYNNELKKISRRGAMTAVFLVSQRPLVTVSGKSYIGSILEDAGLKNAFQGLGTPYPVVSAEAIVRTRPDIIIVMNEGPAFITELLNGFSFPAVINRRIVQISDENIAYYTPSDYIASVKQISAIAGSRLK